jgi:hypothetical protein
MFAAISTANAQVSMAGAMFVPKDFKTTFATIDNEAFTCTLVDDWMRTKAKEGDQLAAMVSRGQAFSMDEEAGFPTLAMITGADGVMRVLMPAVVKFKIDVKVGAVLHLNGYDIHTSRTIKAGDSIPVLYINGPAILSVGAAGGVKAGARATPWFSAFRTDATNRAATIGVWRIETHQK